MKLFIIRHAKASHSDYFPGDIYRTLEKKGYDESMEMAERIRSAAGKPDLIVSSPAIRAFSTALVFALHLNYDSRTIALNPLIYETDNRTLLRIINSIDDKYQSVMLFGHNPGLSDLVNDLCNPVFSGLPTAGIAELEFSVNRWSDVEAGSAVLKNKYFPG